MKRLASLSGLLVALVVTGCGIGDPYNDKPAAPAPAPDSVQPSSAPEDVLRQAADLSINWTSENAAERFEALVPMGTGAASDDFARAAAQTAADPYLDDSGNWSKGTVETIELEGEPPVMNALVVVRQELGGRSVTSGGPRYRVITARLEQQEGKWVITEWAPQP